MKLILDKMLRQSLGNDSDKELFEKIMSLKGKTSRQTERRQTLRIELNHAVYFLKRHEGVGWKEIFKNLLQLRLPILSAKNEWQAIHHLQKSGIHAAKALGYGIQGWNPAHYRSFILLESLEYTRSLNDWLPQWTIKKPPVSVKRQLLFKIAELIAIMHRSGLNHRDCYLLHFLILKENIQSPQKSPMTLYILDLHRAQIRKKVPQRWLIKDCAAFYFSMLPYKALLTSRDWLRLIKHYTGQPLRMELQTRRKFWNTVQRKGERLYQKETRK